MSDQLLNVLKIALLALLYLFFARVLWAVWSEVRTPTAPRAARSQVAAPVAAATVAPPTLSGKAPKGRRDTAARLTILEPKARKGQQIAIVNEITFGRAEGCTVPLPEDTFASQVHARVFASDGQAWVDDLGSTNGTYLNGNRVTEPRRVKPGDRIQIGTTVLEAG